MFGVRVAPGLLVSPIWSDSLPRLTRLMYIVASCATFHEPPCLAGDSHGRWCGGHCGLSCNRALWPPRERTCPRTAGRALRRRGACEASIRARCSGPCPQVVAIHTSRAMHASRVRGSCASGGPPSGTYLWQTSQLARTRSRPGGRATLLCHMPPPPPLHSTLSHITRGARRVRRRSPGAHHHTTHGRPRGTGHHTHSKSRPDRPLPPAPPHDGAQWGTKWGTRLDWTPPVCAGESHADGCRRTREPHGALLARHSRRVAPSHQ